MTTWTKEDGTQRVSIYHSYLSKTGKIILRFTGNVMKGRDNDDMIVPFEVQGDPQQKPYWLKCENDAVAGMVRGTPQNEWVEVEAAGSRDEAVLSIRRADGQAVKPQQAQQQMGFQKGNGGQSKPRVDFIREPFPYGSLEEAYRVALLEAAGGVMGAVSEEMDTAELSPFEVVELLRELAGSMLYRQMELFKSTGKWTPLHMQEKYAEQNPSPTDGEGFATLEQAAELANLFQQVQEKLPDGPEKSGVEKVVGKKEQATRGEVQKCMGYLKGWSGAFDHLHAMTESEQAKFSNEELIPDDDLPF